MTPRSPPASSPRPPPSRSPQPANATPRLAGEETLDVEAVHGDGPRRQRPLLRARELPRRRSRHARSAQLVDENKVAWSRNSYGELRVGRSRRRRRRLRADRPAGRAAGHQASCSPRATTATRSPTPASSRPTTRPPTRTSPRSAARPPRSTPTGTLAFQTGWGTQKYSLSADGKTWDAPGVPLRPGGGYSALFNRPDLPERRGAGPARPGRAVPDVALDADPTTGMLVGETQTFPNGVALRRVPHRRHEPRVAADRRHVRAGRAARRRRLGFLNPAIYARPAPARRTFTDVDADTTPATATCGRTTSTAVDPSDGHRLLASGRSTRTRSLRTAPGLGTRSPEWACHGVDEHGSRGGVGAGCGPVGRSALRGRFCAGRDR